MDDTMGGTRDLFGQARDDEQARNVVVGAGALTVERDYRRGNWTLPETMLLIEAKRKVHEERHPGDQGLARWRWVEDYCWRAGCRRSQNQCNDKWDNLLRDYKKVRDYESRATATAPATAAPAPGASNIWGLPSYWAMERHERKDRNLPTNLAPEVFDALTDVLSRRATRRGGAAIAATPPPPLALPPPHAAPPTHNGRVFFVKI